MSSAFVLLAVQRQDGTWFSINWKTCNDMVKSLQNRIVQSVQQGAWRKAKRLNHLLIRSFSARALAVKRVTENKGKKTAGIDGKRWLTPDQKMQAIGTIARWKEYKPKALKRIRIPKKDKSQTRPLSIPTMEDRARQALYMLALAPIAETLADGNSYGFRSKRRCADAIDQIFKVLRLKGSSQWILEADIKGFFDNIDFDWILQNIPINKKILSAWLNCGFIEDSTFHPTTTGVPQGGIISPVIGNRVLDGLEAVICNNPRYKRMHGINFVRYADDCAPRRRTGGWKSSVQLCCTRDEGRSLEAGVQAQASNHLLRLSLRGLVVSESGKGRARPGQVRIVELNANEPLMMCRKRRNGVETEGESLLRDKSGRNLFTAQTASGMKAARTRFRLLCGTWEPVTPMPREKRKGKPPECESTEAEYRDGVTRSSEENPVMGLERRGGSNRSVTRKQLATGGLS